VRVGWVTHQLPDGTTSRGRGLLQGRYAGGAEMSTEEMLAAAPDDVEVTVIAPDAPEAAVAGFDRVVVGATERLSPTLTAALRASEPILWLRSPQPATLRPLFEAARLVVWPSRTCAEWHPWWQGPYELCPAPMEPDCVFPAEKEGFALWAGRDHPQKGRVEARMWAHARQIPLVELTDAPRDQVLEVMSRATFFVHLPQGIVDPCPRTLIEAELAGCQVVTNRLAGRVEVAGQGPDVVREHIRQVPATFWGWVRDR
jgi:hypothetical protein